MRKLIEQILKFGVVGIICFVVDFAITMIISIILRKQGTNLSVASSLGTLCGFIVSAILNYILSLKFVFDRKKPINPIMELIIFMILSAIGCLINYLIVKFGVLFVENSFEELTVNYPSMVTAGVKILATGIVMVYNFISRKLFLEGGKAKTLK